MENSAHIGEALKVLVTRHSGNHTLILVLVVLLVFLFIGWFLGRMGR